MMIEAIFLGLITAFISNLLLYHDNIILSPIRKWLDKRAKHWFWGYILCPFCMYGRMSFVMAILFWPVTTLRITHVWNLYLLLIFNFIVSCILIWAFAEMWNWILAKTFRAIIDRERDEMKLRKNHATSREDLTKVIDEIGKDVDFERFPL